MQVGIMHRTFTQQTWADIKLLQQHKQTLFIPFPNLFHGDTFFETFHFLLEKYAIYVD
jgi:hypothetical protein